LAGGARVIDPAWSLGVNRSRASVRPPGLAKFSTRGAAMRSRIEPMKKIARSLRKHRELILNYFRAQKLLSSGVVEGSGVYPRFLLTSRNSWLGGL
jgi:hypothetical protein